MSSEKVIKPYALSVRYDRCTADRFENGTEYYELYFDNQKMVIYPLFGGTEYTGWYQTLV